MQQSLQINPKELQKYAKRLHNNKDMQNNY